MSAHTHVHDDASSHAHARAQASVARPVPGFSLLRLSLAGRLAIAMSFVAAIWLLVLWAIA